MNKNGINRTNKDKNMRSNIHDKEMFCKGQYISGHVTKVFNSYVMSFSVFFLEKQGDGRQIPLIVYDFNLLNR